jgi:outer membrane receptor for ferrienterochelin and colicin
LHLLGRLAVVLALGDGAALVAQGVQTGNLTGVVKEAATGKPIAGARVTLVTQQGERNTTSNAKGEFRFALLIPGPVTLRVSATGYIGASLAARVGLGETNVTDFPLKPMSEAAATVTISATANNVDTTDAKTGQTFALEKINDLPINQRTIANITALAPGVSTDANGLTIRGAQSTQVLYLVDGADVADPVTGGFAAQLNEDMLSDVQVLSGGISAEYGRFTGGVVNAVTRSGTNEFTGVIRLTATNPAWNAYNPLGRGLAGNITFKNTHSIQQNFVVSGPILKDRLFFVVGYRAQAPFARSVAAQTTADPAFGGGIPYNATTTDDRKDIKLDWQISSDHRVFWQYNKTEIDQTGRDYAALFFGGSTSLATLSNQPNTFSYYTLGYQGQLASNMMLSVHYGYKKETLGGPGGGGQGAPSAPMMIDLNTFYAFDNGVFGSDPDSRPIKNASISLLAFLSGMGEHELKAGVDWYESSHSAANAQTPSGMFVYFNGFTVDPAVGGSTALSNRVFVPNDPSQTFLDQWIPFFGAKAKNTIVAAYVNDKWKLNSRWSFNLGLRADRFKSENDLGVNNFTLTTVAPRLAAIWDLRGDGAWVTQISYGEYVGQVLQGATDNSSVVGNPAEYDYAYVGGDPTLRSSYSATPFFVFDPSLYRHSNLIDPNLKMPTMQEVAISLKHADGHNGVWSAAFSRRRWKNFVDDFKSAQPNPVDANDQVFTIVKNDPSLVRDYWSLELQFQKQVTEAFSAGGNVTFSELHGNYEGGQVGTTEQINNFGPLGGAPGAYPNAPTRDQLAPYGSLAADVPVRARVTANYVITLGKGRMNVGLLGAYTSGAPYDKKAPGVPLPATVPTFLSGSTYTEYFAPRGAFRFPDTYRLDLQIAYEIPVWKKATFFSQVNFVNFPNHQQQFSWNTTQTVTPLSSTGRWTTGSVYGQARTSNDYISARTVTLSAGLKF